VGVAVRLGLVLVLVAGISACGGDGDEESGGSTNTGSATSVEIDAAAQERAEEVVLQLSDFPTGWRASAAEEEDESGAEKLRECIGVDSSGTTRTGEADSQNFAKEQAEVSSTAAVFAQVAQAESWMSEYTAGLSGSKAADCFQELIEDAYEESGGQAGTKIGEVEVGQLSFTPPAGIDEAAAFQMVVPVEITSGEGAGLSPDIYYEYVILREGDTASAVQTADVLTAFDPELRDQLVAAVAGRMTAPTP
jgi:hypothetical protein